ncbi:unnamed protein product [Rhizoctonia solani]|uniref:Altered inheritance of mitochondria protein 6 n=1 Tax=Rhizoctonia solani TaxID=456999 RepID=A0A8H3I1Y7_9AGAM|nr:unnamed protein product [Rhizoctonia solani]
MSHREESIQDFLSDASNNLFGVIDREKVHGLNLSVPEDAKAVIKPWDERENLEKYCETGVDDELILHVPFSRNVRIKSIIIKTARGDAQPRRLRIYANHPAGLDFAEAESTRPQQDFALLEGGGIVEYPVKAATFANVIALTLFLTDTPGGEINRIYFVGFKGDARDVQKDVSEHLDIRAANAADAPIDRLAEKAAGAQNLIHSHNDYWRDVPLFSAIAVGAISVEADVWLWNDELYVGHDPSSLSPKRTFSSLYVNPILSILKQQNPETSFPYTNNTRYGVFDSAVDQTLYLFVDVKTDGNTTWPLVIKQLEPLREGGWLSYWDAEADVLRPGAVTVVGTGSTPFDQVKAHTTPHRDAFYDAPITSFSQGSSGEYNTSTVVIASGSLASALGGPMSGSTFNDTQIATLSSQIRGAHTAGVKVRYWETPGWPSSKRDYVWKTLEGLGVDLLNADDLKAAAGLAEIW